jgi:hypothetical protein
MCAVVMVGCGGSSKPTPIWMTTSSVSLNGGDTYQFTVTGSSTAGIAWTVSCSASDCGSINSTGMYTAPSVVASAMAVTVTATSSKDNSKATATVNLAPVAVTVTPGSSSLNVHGTQQFTATVTGSTNTAVTWVVSCSLSDCGTISASGLYTAPATINTAAAVTVKATSSKDNTKNATATANLVPVTISVAPGSASLNGGGTQQFTATVAGSANTAVTWTVSCSGSNCGTISAGGLYTAPAAINATDTVAVKATSSADVTKSATASVSLVPVSVSVSPGTASLNGGEAKQFTATVTGSSNTTVTWAVSCSGSDCGSINPSGLYTAPAAINAADTVTVTATSAADNTKSATASITLVPFAMSVAPGGTSLLNQGGTQQFTATVTGASSIDVTWSVSCTGSCGTIDTSGLYTAPSAVASATNVTVTATSDADNTKTATATVTVNPTNATVDFTTTLATLDPYAFGVDITGYGNGSDITNDVTQQNLLKNMNIGMMRMGLKYATSGDPTSQIQCSGGGCSTGVIGDAWISNIKALGAEPMVIVSITAASYHDDAVNLVKHFNISPATGLPDPTLPNYVKYWIIGNEPNLATSPSIPAATYDAKFRELYAAMTDSGNGGDPNILIGGPAVGGSYTGPGSGPYNYIDQFLIDCGDIVNFVDLHKYDLSGSQWSDSPTRLSSSGNTYKYQLRPQQVRAQINAHPLSAARSAQIGIQMGEWNISSNSGSVFTSTETRLPYDFFNVLYGASALGNMMTTGTRAMMFGDKNTALGILADGTTPFGTAQGGGWTTPAMDSPMPIYYAYAMYTGMGLFRHYGTVAVNTSTTITASPNGLDVFASNNEKNIVVVNKNNVANTVTFALAGFTNGTADVWQKAAVGGVIGSSDTTGPKYDPSAIQHLPAVNITNGGFSVSVPAYSVTTFVLN